MPKPTMMTGSLNDPAMKMPLSIPNNDNITEAHVYKRKNPSPVPGHQPSLFERERLHVPLVRGDEDE